MPLYSEYFPILKFIYFSLPSGAFLYHSSHVEISTRKKTLGAGDISNPKNSSTPRNSLLRRTDPSLHEPVIRVILIVLLPSLHPNFLIAGRMLELHTASIGMSLKCKARTQLADIEAASI